MILLCYKASEALMQMCPFQQVIPRSFDPKISEVGLDAIELIKLYGYSAERHENVQTPDGYLLEIHRILPGAKGKSPILLMHGLTSSSADWVNNGREKSLAFLLADLGYDVWMGNARGTTWSRKHLKLNPDEDSKFWDFSWHEIGIYDLPTIIDYILSQTKNQSLHYVGHSQGTTSFFIMASEKPEYNEKIRFMAALAPVAYMKHVKNLVAQQLSRVYGALESVANAIGLYEIGPNCNILQMVANYMCNDGMITQEVCAQVIYTMMGYDPLQLNYTMIPVYATNAPAGASYKQFLHYFQEVESGRFCQYHYGSASNFIFYGQKEAPAYNLKKVTAPIGLYYGANDRLSAIKDVEKLRDRLKNVVVDYLVPHEQFSHVDFLWAIDVVPLLYKKLLEDIESH